MKFGISTFVNDDGIDPVTFAKAIEERGLRIARIAEHTHISASREIRLPDGGRPAVDLLPHARPVRSARSPAAAAVILHARSTCSPV